MQIINNEQRAVKGVILDMPGQRINMDDILPDGMKAGQAYVIKIPAPQYVQGQHSISAQLTKNEKLIKSLEFKAIYEKIFRFN